MSAVVNVLGLKNPSLRKKFLTAATTRLNNVFCGLCSPILAMTSCRYNLPPTSMSGYFLPTSSHMALTAGSVFLRLFSLPRVAP